ncbi:MAG: exodeoxyribonuclease VII small subunit [Clostridia bacterium]|nr:exodeoxyribonuclease VII small subunit [Clostridia bacterium]MCQ2480110.1 exodeoxyribonuclease VII small subunit [Clostridia bacterium]
MKNMTYEQAIKRLEEIADKLDSGSLSLEESLKLFEEGTKLTTFCNSCLEKAKLKITKLSAKEDEE